MAAVHSQDNTPDRDETSLNVLTSEKNELLVPTDIVSEVLFSAEGGFILATHQSSQYCIRTGKGGNVSTESTAGLHLGMLLQGCSDLVELREPQPLAEVLEIYRAERTWADVLSCLNLLPGLVDEPEFPELAVDFEKGFAAVDMEPLAQRLTASLCRKGEWNAAKHEKLMTGLNECGAVNVARLFELASGAPVSENSSRAVTDGLMTTAYDALQNRRVL